MGDHVDSRRLFTGLDEPPDSGRHGEDMNARLEVMGEPQVEGVAFGRHVAVARLAGAPAVPEHVQRAGVGRVVEAGVLFQGSPGADEDAGLEGCARMVELVEDEVGALEPLPGLGQLQRFAAEALNHGASPGRLPCQPRSRSRGR
jgi:hypothetical protein